MPLVWFMRFRYRSELSALDRAHIELMEAWFDADFLFKVRMARPSQIRLLLGPIGRRAGLSVLSGSPRGLCLGHVVLIDQGVQELEQVLFHELVHTEQWRALGACRFLGRYIREILQHGYFDETGLEGMAKSLTDRFERGERFVVQHEIGIAFGNNKSQIG